MSLIDKLLRRTRSPAPALRVLPPFSFQRPPEPPPPSRLAHGTHDENTPIAEPLPVQAIPRPVPTAPPPRRQPPPIPGRRLPPPAVQSFSEDESTIVEVSPGVELRELFPGD